MEPGAAEERPGAPGAALVLGKHEDLALAAWYPGPRRRAMARGLTGLAEGPEDEAMRSAGREVGLGLIEILLALAVLTIAGVLLYHYVGSSRTMVEELQERRPLGQARLAADQATLAAIQALLGTYQATHGKWPGDKAAVLALLPTPPRFQCPGNDIEYDPAAGRIHLLITDPRRC